MANTPALSQPLQGEAALSRVDRDWLTVLGCGICLMLSVGSLLIYVSGVFVRPLAIQFHWTRTQVASALVIGQFVVAFSSPVWGFLVDRFGPRRVILPSIVGLSLAFASLSLLTPHLWHLYLLYGLFALLGGGSSPIGYAAVLVRSFERHLGLALGLSLMGIGVGAAVLPSLAQAFVSHLGWRYAYAAVACSRSWFHCRRPSSSPATPACLYPKALRSASPSCRCCKPAPSWSCRPSSC